MAHLYRDGSSSQPLLSETCPFTLFVASATLFALSALINTPAQAQWFNTCAEQDSHTGENYIPQEECEALRQIYDSLEGWSAGGRPIYWFHNEENACLWDGIGNLTGPFRYEEEYSFSYDGAIPGCVGGRLYTLGPAGFALQGEIPSEVGQLNNLGHLSFAANRLSGEIPHSLTDLSNLLWLSLTRNNLTGEIPPELGNLVQLEHLSLASNGFEGEIPTQLGQLSNLVEFYLHDNNLRGTVPLEVARVGAAAKACDFSGNDLFIPDTPEYRALASSDSLCGLPVGKPLCSSTSIAGTVRNVNLYGEPGVILPSTAVELIQAGEVIATQTTDAAATFEFQELDRTLAYDLRVSYKRNGEVYERTRYDLNTCTGEEEITLPIYLIERESERIDSLEASLPFSLGYEMNTASSLLESWQRDDKGQQQETNEALSRLALAHEAAYDLWISSRLLADETAEVTVKGFLYALALRKLARGMELEFQHSPGWQDLEEQRRRMVLEYWKVTASWATKYVADNAFKAIKARLSPEAASWFAPFFSVLKTSVEAGLTQVIGGKKWTDDAQTNEKLIQDLLAKVLTEALQEAVAYSYIRATQDDVGRAVQLAEDFEGEGTVQDAHAAVAQSVALSLTGNDEALAASEALVSTVSGANTYGLGWDTLAELVLTGKAVPLLRGIGSTIKAANLGTYAGAATIDAGALFNTATGDVPNAISLAFNPNAIEPNSLRARPPFQTAGHQSLASAPGSVQAFALSLSDYEKALQDVVTLVQEGASEDAVLSQIDTLLSEEERLSNGLDAMMWSTFPTAHEAAESQPGFSEAYEEMLKEGADLAGNRLRLASVVIGKIAPSLAGDEAAAAFEDSLDVVAQDMSASLAKFEGAVSQLQDLTTGTAAPAFVLVTSQSLSVDSVETSVPFTVEVTIRNVGDAVASGVDIALVPDSMSSLTSLDSLYVGDLTPGEERTVSWELVLTRATAPVGGYAVYISSTDARTLPTSGTYSLLRYSATTIEQEHQELPSLVSLAQNYPNPFNPETIIAFTVTSPMHVQLSVYNTLGERVAVLFEGRASSKTYEVRFSAEQLPSGVYFYRLASDAGVETRRMVLLR